MRIIKRHKGSFSTAVVAFLTVVLPALPANAQDSLRTVYEHLYGGDGAGAYNEFRTQSDREPENLGASYGVLMALHSRGLRNPTLQKEFEARIDQLIQKASARYEKNKRDTDAVFYLEQGYLTRARYRMENDKGIVGAARDGIKAKTYADECIKLDPGRPDGYLAAGLYNYYVDIMPAAFKWLRTLLFMPAGNRTEGLKQLARVAESGDLFAPAAQDFLLDIYASEENRYEDAVRMAENLQKKYPENPQFRFTVAGLYSNANIEDYERAAQQYSTIIQRVDQKHPHYKDQDRYQAVMNLARMRQSQWRYDEAISLLTPVIDSNVTQPDWIMPNFLLTRANYRALMGDSHAADDSRQVLSNVKWKNRQASAQQQLKWIEQRQQSSEGKIFAELIPGNRLVSEHRWDEARQEYDKLRSRYPNDWQVRYRIAYLQFARADYAQCESALNPIVNANAREMPDWIKPAAMLQLARIYDIRGQREQAVAMYKRIVAAYEKTGPGQTAQAGLVTPYRRPAALLSNSK